MFTIGDFARHGRVSVRMLRHYDAIGLLRPARVDRFNGYRFYSADQLARLNRIIALKDLGFTLRQVRTILDEDIGAEELHGMFRLRRAELASVREAAAVRLRRIEARLRTIAEEGSIGAHEVVVKAVPPVRVAELTGAAASFDAADIGPVVGPLFEELAHRLERAGLPADGPGIASYEDAAGGGGEITVHAAIPLPGPHAATGTGADIGAGAYLDGVGIVDLPALARAATVVHHGPVDGLMPTAQALARWIDDSGYTSAGYAREVYLESPSDPEGWVTELQEPVTGPR